jgi:2-methylisocitrate lyase-like PEP mutase family enzyme
VLTVQPTMTVQHLASLGVRRISVGGALARMAWAGFMQSAQEIAGRGTFTSFANGAKGGELNKLFGS